ncbi:hypothetical protein ACMDCR_32420 [Labrys okinawensis]|uniref:hypothetical protein n=1 Tax=Labrys okinawensis TaxID=346911 RepID=UPI0039BCAD70
MISQQAGVIAANNSESCLRKVRGITAPGPFRRCISLKLAIDINGLATDQAGSARQQNGKLLCAASADQRALTEQKVETDNLDIEMCNQPPAVDWLDPADGEVE